MAVPDIKVPSSSNGELASEKERSRAHELGLDRILLPLDGSDESEQALPYAATIARRFGGEINLFHCLQPMHPVRIGRPGQLPYPDAQHDRGTHLATAYLEEVKARLKPHGLNARWNVATGDAAELIAYRAATGRFGLTFLSIHNRSRVVRGLQANVTADLWKLTAGPLFLINQTHIRLNGSRPPDPETIFIPVRSSGSTQTALPIASTLAAALKARLVLLLNVPETKEANVTRSVVAKSAEQLVAEELAEQLRGNGCDVEVENTTGGVIGVARRQLQDRGSWVVASSRMRSGISRLLRGSDGETFLRQCRGPLIVVPEASVAKSREKRIRKKMVPQDSAGSTR